MIVAVEDVLSEAVVRKIVSTVRPDAVVTAALGLKGKGYLKNKAPELNRTASAVPVFVLVDQDSPSLCPAGIAADWFGGELQPNMVFRVAVMEVESWVLAHRTGCAALLSIAEERIPQNPDQIVQPKEFIVNLARRSRSKRVRDEFVPAPGSTAGVGPAYNLRLAEFVEKEWSPVVAADASPSLQRTIRRLRSHNMERAG
jgi:hypothetical protein